MSFCTTTVSNSVRKIAPVGHASRHGALAQCLQTSLIMSQDRKSTRLNSSHLVISYAVFCLKKKKETMSLPTVITTVPHIDLAGPRASAVTVLTVTRHDVVPAPLAVIVIIPTRMFCAIVAP